MGLTNSVLQIQGNDFFSTISGLYVVDFSNTQVDIFGNALDYVSNTGINIDQGVDWFSDNLSPMLRYIVVRTWGPLLDLDLPERSDVTIKDHETFIMKTTDGSQPGWTISICDYSLLQEGQNPRLDVTIMGNDITLSPSEQGIVCGCANARLLGNELHDMRETESPIEAIPFNLGITMGIDPPPAVSSHTPLKVASYRAVGCQLAS